MLETERIVDTVDRQAGGGMGRRRERVDGGGGRGEEEGESGK
jgi:hypothetical protein